MTTRRARTAKKEINWNIPSPRSFAELNAKALRKNYRILRELVPSLELLPMVKADAYGHGVLWAAKILADLPKLHGLGVATLEEGRQLREGLGSVARNLPITVFSGAMPWTESAGQFCQHYRLTPVIGTEPDWRKFFQQGWPGRIHYELKFNTGMNRLGISFDQASEISRILGKMPIRNHPVGVLTHLAIAEDPDARESREQIAKFSEIRKYFATKFSQTKFHFANSAAIWRSKSWKLKNLTDIARPGISLYGIPPWPGAVRRKLLPAMTVYAQVLAIHHLKPGECVGYGATFMVPETALSGLRVAILGTGYADGFHRFLSGRGHVWLGKRSVRVLGRVSMDMVAVECFEGIQAGDYAEWIGPHVDPWRFASEAGTNPYEILTSIGARVQKNYV